jgi:hypothetical protein
VGKFDWYVPGNIKKDNNYKLKFTNAKDRNDVVYSRPFAIKPKIPLLVKVAGVVLLAVAVEVVVSNSTSSSEAKAYAAPPSPPNN